MSQFRTSVTYFHPAQVPLPGDHVFGCLIRPLPNMRMKESAEWMRISFA